MRGSVNGVLIRKLAMGAGVLAVSLGAFGGAAYAQRDPAYAAARASGQIGEKMDGYLGVVGSASPEVRALVSDLNIKRKAVYAQKAQAAKVTIEEYAFGSGCDAIARTAPGEKYEAPGGGWQTRGSGPPQRDSRCP